MSFMESSEEFEKAFGSFLDRHEYDAAESALFNIVRLSFLAGWTAAHGETPTEEPVFQLVVSEKTEAPKNKSGKPLAFRSYSVFS